MAAQVLVQQLSMELYRIDLPPAVSKYIGETEKKFQPVSLKAHPRCGYIF
jgi:hypothetical protein